ncbi:uncharacterized protein LOC114351591 [Ostrinia furnacalis]|uniref:uncharacterized protein LOC114351591 n=1 Tax=Ostrinia furnacalis TaxID=93504 RepID=UPI00103F4145|nr:uncharacterized protein LOC114351591 [Ostrinia furnacalis]
MSTPTRKRIRNFIQAYKSLPQLWDRKHRDYLNKSERSKAFEILRKVYQQIEEDASVQTVKRKINDLRSVYMKELKKVRASRLTARSPGDVHEPTLWHYKDMSFLEHVLCADASAPPPGEEQTPSSPEPLMVFKIEDVSTPNEHEATYEDSEDYGGESSSITCTQPSASSNVRNNSVNCSSGCAAMLDPDDVIGRSIGVQLKDLDKKQKTIAMKLISDAIYYANLGRLDETSYLHL